MQSRNGVYVTAQALAANDVVPLESLSGNWNSGYSPRANTNLAVLNARSEIGVEWSGFRLGMLRRSEVFAQTNRDTADLVRQYQNQTGYTAGKTYAVDYRVAGFDADGFKLSKSERFNFGASWEVAAGVGVSYLRGRKLKLETWDGSVTSVSTQDFNANLEQDTADSDININDVQAFTAPYGRMASMSGQGYAMDAGLVLEHRPSGFMLDLTLADIAGQVDWVNVPTNMANLTTATKTYDADGYVQYDPSVTRRSSYRNMTMLLEPKVRLALSAPVGQNTSTAGARALLALDSTRGHTFWQAGLSFPLVSGWQCVVDTDFRFQTLGLGLSHQYLQVNLRTDSADLKQAKAAGLALALRIPL